MTGIYTKSKYDVICEAVRENIAPVIYSFACFIVNRAKALGIEHLYFFSRDGYTVMKAAEEICRKADISLEMSYFYCSRYSFRMAAYRFKDASAYDKLFGESYRMTAKTVLMRAGFEPDERMTVYEELGMELSDEEKLMNRNEFRDFCSRLKASPGFQRMLSEKSDKAYCLTADYIRQCGMDKYSSIGVVDLGWTGSMQLTLKRLLDSLDIKCRIMGFYLGMLEEPEESRDNLYEPWLFEGSKDCFTKAWFSQNILECICTAPHGMTVGYAKNESGIFPVFSENENDPELVGKISDIISDYARQAAGFEYVEKKDKKNSLNKLKKLMFTPDEKTAESFGVFCFCDDVSESYHGKLCEKVSPKTILNCIIRKKGTVRPYWFYGAVSHCSPLNGIICRYLYYFSEAARYFIIAVKKGGRNNG